MADISWKHPVSGDFKHASSWKGGVVPGAGDEAILKAAASAYTVTATAAVTVEAIRIGANATLVDAAGFTATAGGMNAGTIFLNTEQGFTIGGTFVNTGGIELNPEGDVEGGLLMNRGTITGFAGAGYSYVGSAVKNTGSIVAATGVLVVTGPLSGTGDLVIDGGAAMNVHEVGAALSIDFDGPGATLGAPYPKMVHATLYGFAPGDVISLLGVKADSATLEAGDKLVVVTGHRGSSVTFQLSGDYDGYTFHAAGSDITVTGPDDAVAAATPAVGAAPAHAFIAAMASHGAGAGGALLTTAHAPHPAEAMLSAPRACVA